MGPDGDRYHQVIVVQADDTTPVAPFFEHLGRLQGRLFEQGRVLVASVPYREAEARQVKQPG